MPVASRLLRGATSRARRPAAGTKPQPKCAWEERWWFPLGSITRVGEGAFRWHCVGCIPETGGSFLFSGRLLLESGVGVLLDEDSDEGELDEDPSTSWYENLPPFPYVHVFYDSSMDADDCELGPWLCIHGHYGKTRVAVEEACARDS